MTEDKTTMKIGKTTRSILKHIVHRDETYEDLIQRRIKCDAAGCQAAGSIAINVAAGKFGEITLFLCPTCIGKFQDD